MSAADGRERAGGAGGPGPPDVPSRTRDADVWEALARWRAERRPFVLASVTETRGFTPRKAGAHMLIAADALVGTVGGGAIEQEVVREARRLLVTGGSTTVRRHLTQELGMCCGGAMTVFLEAVAVAPRLHLFGAGYIAKPLAAIAAGCGFEVTVVDARPDWATPERFPTATVRLQEPDDFVRSFEPGEGEYAVVVTHDHALDQRVVERLLRLPLAFVGMVGSVPKQRKFALRLRARGYSDADIARLRSPLGLPIGADTPEEIAVSVVAELVAHRRGVALRPVWQPRPRSEGPDAGAEDTPSRGGTQPEEAER